MVHRANKSFSTRVSAVIAAIGGIATSPIVIVWILSIGGLLALTAVSVPKLRATRISAANVQVSFDNPPVWLEDSLLLELQDITRMHLANTAIGRAGLIDAVDALESTGWFSKIDQIQWVSSNQAVVHALFLVPYVIIQDEEGFTYLDAQARKLPSRTGSIVKPNYHFVRLDNPTHASPQRPGLQWDGGDVLAGISLLKLIYDKPWVTQIQSIDLSSWSTDRTLTLQTDTPSHLTWGSPPGEEHGLEALADEKIDRLNWMYTKYGRVDQGVSRDFDLTDTDKIIIQ